MKFQPTQLISVRYLIPLYVFSFLASPVSGQNATEEPAQSVLKEDTSAETTSDNPTEEPQEFTPPCLLYTSPSPRDRG